MATTNPKPQKQAAPPTPLGTGEAVQGPMPQTTPVPQVDTGFSEQTPEELGQTSPMPETQPTAAPTPAPVAEPVEEESDPLKLAQQYISPELYAELEKTASPDMSLGEVFALTGLAAANPDVYKQVVQNKTASSINARNVLAQLQSQAVQHDKALKQQGAYNKRAEQQNWTSRVGQLQHSARSAKVGLAPAPTYDSPDREAWELESGGSIDEGFRAQEADARQAAFAKRFNDLLPTVLRNNPPLPGGEEAWLRGVIAPEVMAGGLSQEEADAYVEKMMSTGAMQAMAQSSQMQIAQDQVLVQAKMAKWRTELAQGWARLAMMEKGLEVELRREDGLTMDRAVAMVNGITALQANLQMNMLDLTSLISVAEKDSALRQGLTEYLQVQTEYGKLANRLAQVSAVATEGAMQRLNQGDTSQAIQVIIQDVGQQIEAHLGIPGFGAWALENKDTPEAQEYWQQILTMTATQLNIPEGEALRRMNEIAISGKVYGQWLNQDVIPDLPSNTPTQENTDAGQGTAGPPE